MESCCNEEGCQGCDKDKKTNPGEVKIVTGGALASPATMEIPGVTPSCFGCCSPGHKKAVQSFFLGDSVDFSIPIPNPGAVIVLSIRRAFAGSKILVEREFRPEDQITEHSVRLAGHGFCSSGSYVWDMVEVSGPCADERRRVIATGRFSTKMSAGYKPFY